MCQSRILNTTPEQVFELVFAKALESYYEIKQNNNQVRVNTKNNNDRLINSFQVCFLFNKTNLQNHNGYKTLQDFLDHSEYAEKSILKYELVRGPGFVTIGGSILTHELVKRLDLTKSQRLLNFGCATGGSSFQIAQVCYLFIEDIKRFSCI